VQLFKALLTQQAEKKKTEWGANCYTAIKKRLRDNLGAYIAEQIVEKEAQIEVELIKKVLLARKLIRSKKYKTAFTVLSKAQQKAKQARLYSILNEIHHSMHVRMLVRTKKHCLRSYCPRVSAEFSTVCSTRATNNCQFPLKKGYSGSQI